MSKNSETFIENLMTNMSLEDKLGQMMQLPAVSENADEFIEKYRVGSYLHAVGDRVKHLNSLNKEKSRLNIPLVFGIDAIHGHCFEDKATVFPVQLALACSWNVELLKEVGKVTAREARASGLHWTFSPVLCIGRDPRWGRCSETFGEDPVLIAELASALVEGYQGADVSFAACAKHFAAYGETDGGRDAVDAHVSERQMRTVFLPPFKKAIDAGCMSLMAAYQALNGIPVSANTWLMNTILREEWGYDGVVVTDWNNVGQMLLMQGVARDIKEAVALCLDASNDIFMTTPEFFSCARELVHEGRIAEARIDESVRRILKFKYELGLFEEEQPSITREQVLADQKRWDLALDAAQQSLVLLKNSGILPLDKAKIKNVLLVGENARDIYAQLGDWSFIPGPQQYQDHVTHRSTTVTLESAMREYCQTEAIHFTYLEGCGPLLIQQIDEEKLLEAADKAGCILFCGGDTLKQHGEYHDRANLHLSGNQQATFNILKQSGKPIVSVMLMSKPLVINDIAEQTDALLLAFNPGALGGRAITQCLFGEFNPSGKLPISFPRHEGQLPVYYYQSPGWHASLCPLYDKRESYIDLLPGPLFHFGEGKGYSKLVYGEAELSASCIKQNQHTVLRLKIENTGELDALEIVQVYVRQIMPGVTTPKLRLLDFQRVPLAKKSQSDVEFSISYDDLRYLNKELQWETPAGETLVFVGSSSKSEDLQTLRLQIL